VGDGLYTDMFYLSTIQLVTTSIYFFHNDLLVSVAHWHSARWGWNGYQPGLGSIPRPGRIVSGLLARMLCD